MSMFDCAVCNEKKCEHVLDEHEELESLLKEAVRILYYSKKYRSLNVSETITFLNKPKILEIVEGEFGK